jgi:hypothetical protein
MEADAASICGTARSSVTHDWLDELVVETFADYDSDPEAEEVDIALNEDLQSQPHVDARSTMAQHGSMIMTGS